MWHLLLQTSFRTSSLIKHEAWLWTSVFSLRTCLDVQEKREVWVGLVLNLCALLTWELQPAVCLEREILRKGRQRSAMNNSRMEIDEWIWWLKRCSSWSIALKKSICSSKVAGWCNFFPLLTSWKCYTLNVSRTLHQEFRHFLNMITLSELVVWLSLSE